tara:strand:+ start:5882 stop:6805 length:924 start_codon:yes stop_codon:yes gene_type:complete
MTEIENVIAVEDPAIPQDNLMWDEGSETNNENPVELESIEQAPINNTEEVSVDNNMPENTEGDTDQQRYQYWQSRYDQKASEFDNISKKLSDFERIAPIAEYIQSNPDVLKTVASSLSGNNPSVPSQEKSVELPQKPTRPTKPTNYDATESVMDADSDSYKYRIAMEEFRDGMIDYQEEREAFQVKQLEAKEQEIANRQAQFQEQRAKEEMLGQLTANYGYTPEKAQAFVEYYSSPESISLENLVNLDKLRSAPSQQEVVTKQKAQSMANRSEQLKVPTPAGIVSGQAEPQYTDEDLFNMSLMANKR